MVVRPKPKDLDELRSLLDNGFGEDHYREFKRQLPPKNKDIARQLAGFSIDGGSLAIGVAEPDPDRFEIALVPHSGLPERVEQIAQASVDPPLFIESCVLKDRDDPSRGVLWITVPPSPEAPHQVGGRYYERGDKQTRPMSDAAVERLIRERRKTLEEIESKLREVMAADPIPDAQTGHIFGVARPIGAAPEELYDAIGGDDGWFGFSEGAKGIIKEYSPVPRPSSGWSSSHEDFRPWYQLGRSGHSTPDGYMVHSGENLDTGDDDFVLRMYFREAGTIRYFNNLGSRRIDNVWRIPADEYFLYAERIVASCLDVLDAARAVARHTGRCRSWDVGFGLTGTEGLRECGGPPRDFRVSRQPFPDPSYRHAVRVSHQQLEADVWGVARKLTRRFLRGCDLTFEQVAHGLGYQEPGDAP